MEVTTRSEKQMAKKSKHKFVKCKNNPKFLVDTAFMDEKTKYDQEKDVEFYGDEPQSYISVYPGQCVIFFPEDAHAPNIGVGRHKKLCVKIAID